MIRFSKYLWIYFLLSALVLVPGMYSLVRWGLVPAIDFTGGTLLEVSVPKPVTDQMFMILAGNAKVTLSSIQQSQGGTYLLRLKPEQDSSLKTFEETLLTLTKPAPKILRNETVGPVLGKELLTKALAAALLAIIGILSYVAYAFRNVRFGVAAIVALAHDLLVVLGCFSLFGHFFHVEVDTLFVTAFLTTMSFSVHDTIVVFDRIREYRKYGDRMVFDDLCDRALTETIGRSTANSLTIIFMLLALVLLGGSTTYWFVVALLIGTVSGTYSSPFVATPVLLVWNRRANQKKKS